jgi:hypothetical protein
MGDGQNLPVSVGPIISRPAAATKLVRRLWELPKGPRTGLPGLYHKKDAKFSLKVSYNIQPHSGLIFCIAGVQSQLVGRYDDFLGISNLGHIVRNDEDVRIK